MSSNVGMWVDSLLIRGRFPLRCPRPGRAPTISSVRGRRTDAAAAWQLAGRVAPWNLFSGGVAQRLQLPAHREALERVLLDLPHSRRRDADLATDLGQPERLRVAVEPEAHLDHPPLLRRQLVDRLAQEALDERHLDLLVGRRGPPPHQLGEAGPGPG